MMRGSNEKKNTGKILTISVAAYNMEPYIRKTLGSLVVPEILDKLEVFVVDDGGTDATLDIAKEYEAKYPGIFHAVHKENGGYGSTINYSIANATGKYFKQLDGDDWYNSDGLLKIIRKLETLDVDYFITPTVIFKEISNTTEWLERFKDTREGLYDFAKLKLSDSFKKHSSVSMHGSIFRTELLRAANVEITEHCFYTDVELVVEAIPSVETVYICHDSLYVYRSGREGQSMSPAQIRKNYKDHEKVYWKMLDVYCNLNPEEIVKREFIEYRLVREASKHFKWLCILPFSDGGFEKSKKFYKGIYEKDPDLLKAIKFDGKYAYALVTSRCLAYPLMRILNEIYEPIKAKIMT